MAIPKWRTYCQEMFNYCAQEIRAAHWYYTAKILAGGQTINVLKINKIANLRDFELNYADHITAECLIWHDEYTQHIHGNRNNLEIILTKEEKHESYELDLNSPRRIARKYRAVIISQTDPDISSSQSGTPQSPQPIAASRRQMTLQVQLIEIAAEKLSKSTFGGIIGETSTEDAIRFFLGEPARLEKLDYGLAIEGVEIVPPDVKIKQAQVLIPHGTPTLSIPEAFQKDWGGVYNHGIGCYVKEKHIFVYPKYDLTRFSKEKIKATIVVVPQSLMGNTKRTYVTNNGEVIILVAAEIEIDDTTNAKQANEGNGQTVFDSARVFNAPVKDTQGKVIPDVASAMSSFVTKKREDGLDFAPFANQAMTRNMAEVLSQNSKEMGRMMTALWEWSYPEVLNPMMPCRVVYFKADFKHELYGVILKTQSFTQLEGGEGPPRHRTTTGLVLYVQRESTEKEKQEDEANKSFIGLEPLMSTLSAIFK